jgi:hypothetical protein
MSVKYGVGGAATALAVVGTCKSSPCPIFFRRREWQQQQRLTDDDDADMLFTGDGEAFNVRLCRPLPLNISIADIVLV